MLPVTEASLVSKMGDRRTYFGVPPELRSYVKTEYAGDGGEVVRMLAEAARAPRPTRQRRGFLSALFEAVEAALPSAGGA